MIERLGALGHLGFRVAAVGCVIVAGYLGLAASDADRVRDGVDLLDHGRFAAAADRIDGVRSEPAASEAEVVRAFAARGRGDFAGAERAFAAALAARPNDWAIRRERALNLLDLGRRPAARRQMRRALELNPLARVPTALAG